MGIKNATKELLPERREAKESELRRLRATIAVDEATLRNLNDSFAERRRVIRDLENHHQAMTARLADPGEAASTPKVRQERREQAKRAYKLESEKITALKAELETAQKTVDDLQATIETASKRRAAIIAAIDGERRQRVKQQVDEAVLCAPSAQLYHTELDKLHRLRLRAGAAEHELHLLMTAVKPSQSVETRAAEFLASGAEVVPDQQTDFAVKAKKLAAEETLIRTALAQQERVVHRLRLVFAGECAATLRPALAALAQTVSAGIEAARSAGVESEQLRVALAVATGSGEMLPCVRFPFLPQDWGTDDTVRQFETRLAEAGLLA
jgi:uncharacterized coiled-coil protein SlyX